MRVVWACVAVGAFFAFRMSSSAAQVVVGDEIDPVTAGAFARPASIVRTTDGIALVGGSGGVASSPTEPPSPVSYDALYLDDSLSRVGVTHDTAGRMILAGHTTYLALGSGGRMFRARRSDDVALDAPAPGVVGGTHASMSVLADTYLFAGDTQLVVWAPTSSLASSPVEAPPCAGCRFTGVACGAVACAVLVDRGDGSLALQDVDPSMPTAPLGDMHDLGIAHSTGATLRAWGSGWVVIDADYVDPAPNGRMSFVDAARSVVATIPHAPDFVADCTVDACFAIEANHFSRVTPAGVTPLAAIDGLTLSRITDLTCAAHGCVLSAGVVEALDLVTGALVPMTDRISRSAFADMRALWVGPSGAFVVVSDERVGVSSPILLSSSPIDPAAASVPVASASAFFGGASRVLATGAMPSLLEEDGRLVSSPTLPAACDTTAMHVAWTGGAWALACSDADGAVRFAVLDERGTASTRAAVVPGAASGQYVTLLAATSARALVARAGPSDLSVISLDGAVRTVPVADAAPMLFTPVAGTFLELDRRLPLAARGSLWIGDEPRVLSRGEITYALPPSSIVAAFDGTWWTIVAVESSGAGRWVRLDWLSPDGEVAPLPTRYVGDSVSTGRPIVTSDGSGTAWVAYSRLDQAVRTNRARVRILRSGDALGRACVEGTSCGSGVCVEGICCTRACDAPCEVCTAAAGATFDGLCTRTCAPDAGLVDAATDAAASYDAGTDASIAVDAGRDAFVASIDASAPTDAAGEDRDAGGGGPAPGCACTIGTCEAPDGVVAMFAAWLWRVRRRARQRARWRSGRARAAASA